MTEFDMLNKERYEAIVMGVAKDIDETIKRRYGRDFNDAEMLEVIAGLSMVTGYYLSTASDARTEMAINVVRRYRELAREEGVFETVRTN